jgi:hypothetical protein
MTELADLDVQAAVRCPKRAGEAGDHEHQFAQLHAEVQDMGRRGVCYCVVRKPCAAAKEALGLLKLARS